MTKDENQVDAKYVRDILRYFLLHPQAADNLEGLAKWRLLDQKIQETLTQVSRALIWLVARKMLVKDKAHTSSPMYRLNESRREEIGKLLEDLERE